MDTIKMTKNNLNHKKKMEISPLNRANQQKKFLTVNYDTCFVCFTCVRRKERKLDEYSISLHVNKIDEESGILFQENQTK